MAFDEEGATLRSLPCWPDPLWQEDAVLSLKWTGDTFSCKLFELEQLNDHQPVNQAEYLSLQALVV